MRKYGIRKSNKQKIIAIHPLIWYYTDTQIIQCFIYLNLETENQTLKKKYPILICVRNKSNLQKTHRSIEKQQFCLSNEYLVCFICYEYFQVNNLHKLFFKTNLASDNHFKTTLRFLSLRRVFKSGFSKKFVISKTSFSCFVILKKNTGGVRPKTHIKSKINLLIF